MNEPRTRDSGEPRFSVIIVNWNTREKLERCLASLRPDLAERRCEVIVVDNGSTDGSCEMLESTFPEVVLVRNAENLGFARAVNQGHVRATCEYLLLLNSDAEVRAETLRRSAEFMDAHPDVAVSGCRIVYPDGTHQGNCFRFHSLLGVLLIALYLEQAFKKSTVFNRNRYGDRDWSEPTEVDCVTGCYFVVRASALGGDPLLDDGYFMYGEEVDLCRKLKAGGWKTFYVPGTEVVHQLGGSARNVRVAAWCYVAKRRAILRFIHKWDGVLSAWLANLLLLGTLLPRIPVWALADLRSRLRAGSWEFARLRRARVAGFHLACLLRPALFDRNWDPPDPAPRRVPAAAAPEATRRDAAPRVPVGERD